MKTVLIVDDDEPTRDFMKQLVDSLGYKVLWAADGQAAMDIAVQSQPDLMLLDVMMPEKHGYSVCHSIKTDAVLKRIKVVFLTSKAFPADRRQAQEVGADDYIAKPVTRDQLGAVLKQHLGE
jgi:CheY-like chemotaxis protein